MKKILLVVKNKYNLVVDARTCGYSYEFTDLVEALEPGDTITVLEPRIPKPAPETEPSPKVVDGEPF